MALNSLLDYGGMIRDSVRINAYYEALRRCISPDSVVVDLGAGTGIFSLMACQLGAKHVYAIDPNPWIHLGKQLAAANGFADQITFIQDLSTHVTLPEQADIIVSELRAAQPLFKTNIPNIADARKRFLKPGGILIPQHDIVYAALINEPIVYQSQVTTPWLENDLDLDLSAASNFARHTPRFLRELTIPEPILPPRVWADIDYSTREDPNASAHIEWIADEASTAHYILTWFDTYLFEDIGFSTAPWKKRSRLYGNELLPLQAPLEISSGDQIMLDLKANFINQDYIFSWNTRVYGKDRDCKISFNQSTFLSTLLIDKRQELHKPAPKLNNEGQIARMILNGFGEGTSDEKIALLVSRKFPSIFKDAESVLPSIAEIAALYRT